MNDGRPSTGEPAEGEIVPKVRPWRADARGAALPGFPGPVVFAARAVPCPVRAFAVRYRYELALLATVAIWGINVPVLKFALRELAPGHANALRFTLGALTLGLVGWVERRRRGVTLREAIRGHEWTLVGLGLFGYFFYQEAFIFGISRTSAASAALLTSTAPLWTAAIGHATGIDRLRRSALPGMALALGGAVVVALARTGSGIDTLTGNLTILASSVFWALFTVRQARLAGKVPPATGASVSILVALVGLYAVAFLTTPTALDLGALSGATIAALVFSGTLSVGLTFAVWNAAVAHVGPTTTASFGYLTPLFAAAMGYALLGEPVTLYHLAGAALLIGGLVWMRRGKARVARQAREAEALEALPVTGSA